jgi:hypothetical protein
MEEREGEQPWEVTDTKKIGMTFLSCDVTICHTKIGALPPLPKQNPKILPQNAGS